MYRSIQEEIIAALWAICALIAFGFGFDKWGWFFAIKSILDTACAIKYVILEVREELKQGDK